MNTHKFNYFLLILKSALYLYQSLIAQEVLWTKTFDNGPDDHAKDVCVDGEGNIIVTGTTKHYLNNGDDWLTIKYNPKGDTLWTRRFNITISDKPAGVAVDPWDNIIITGAVVTDSTAEDFCTVKYDSDGRIKWVRTLSTNSFSEEAGGCAVDSKGNVFITGTASMPDDTLSFGSTLIKYDTSGVLQWHKCLRWNDKFTNGKAITIDKEDNILVTGYTVRYGYDFFIAKFNQSGDTLWTRVYHKGADDWPYGIACDSEGNVIICGIAHYPFDYSGYLKFDKDGNYCYENFFENSSIIYDVITDAENNILMVGTTYDTSFAGKSHGYFVKYSPSGTILSSEVFSNGFRDGFDGIASFGSGKVVITGTTYSENATEQSDFLTLVWDLPTAIQSGKNKNFPGCLELFQNFPNPFNVTTRINYYLSKNTDITIKIYNIKGMQIQSLYQGYQTRGTHSLLFDGSSLASGIYFCTLSSAGNSVTKKLLLVK